MIFTFHPGTSSHRAFPHSRDCLRCASATRFKPCIPNTLALGYLHIILEHSPGEAHGSRLKANAFSSPHAFFYIQLLQSCKREGGPPPPVAPGVIRIWLCWSLWPFTFAELSCYDSATLFLSVVHYTLAFGYLPFIQAQSPIEASRVLGINFASLVDMAHGFPHSRDCLRYASQHAYNLFLSNAHAN